MFVVTDRIMTGRSNNCTPTIAYIRVSTEQQSEEGHSLTAQRSRLDAYAGLYGLNIVRTEVDTGSAKTLNRPGLTRALESLANGVSSALLVSKLDRLTRNVRDLGELVETYFAPGKAALLSVSEQVDTRTASGRLVLNVLGSVSQWERETIAERTRETMGHMRRKGLYVGGKAPFGFRRVGEKGAYTLERDDREQAILDTVLFLRKKGYGYRKIATSLAERGMVSREGSPLSHIAVRAMLCNRDLS